MSWVDSATKQYSNGKRGAKDNIPKGCKIHTPSVTTGLNFIKVTAARFQGHKTLLQSHRGFIYTCRGRIVQLFCALLTVSWTILEASCKGPDLLHSVAHWGPRPHRPAGSQHPQGRREAPLAGSLDAAPSVPLPFIWANVSPAALGDMQVWPGHKGQTVTVKRLRPLGLSPGFTVH